MSLVNNILTVASFAPSVWHAAKSGAHALLCFPQKYFKTKIEPVSALPGMQSVFDANPDLRRDIKLIPSNDRYDFEACGINKKLSFGNDACVRVNRAMLQLEPEGTRYFIKKEIYHIKHDHPLKTEIVKSIVTLAVALCCIVEGQVMGVTIRLPTLIGAEMLIDGIVCRRWEDHARSFALKEATTAELHGALSILEAIRRVTKSTKRLYEAKCVEAELKERKVTHISYDSRVAEALHQKLKS